MSSSLCKPFRYMPASAVVQAADEFPDGPDALGAGHAKSPGGEGG